MCIRDSLKNYEIVRAMLALTSNLNLETVAEGIETTEERDWLTKLGCDFAQGFLFSHPLPAEEAVKMLTSPTKDNSR